MDGIDAIKQIHKIGELNALLSILYVAIVIVAIFAIGKKVMDVLGLETKASLYRKAQEERITNLENTVNEILKEIDDKHDALYKKQKGYHEQSIQIRDQLKQNQEGLSSQITDLSNMMSNFITTQNDRTVASFRSSLWRMHKDFTSQGYITPDGLKTFLEMGKIYEKAGGNDIYHEILLPDIEKLEIKYPEDEIL